MNDRPRDRDARPEIDSVWLEAALADLAGVLDVGPTPDIAGAVRRRLAGRPPAARAAAVTGGGFGRRFLERIDRRWWPWRPLPRAVALALLVLLVIAGLAVAAIGLGLPGLRIMFVEASPTPSTVATTAPATSPSAASALPGTGSPSASPAAPAASPTVVDLGAPTTLAGARDAVDFRLYVPAAIAGSAPPNVFLDPSLPDGRVALVYPPAPARPLPSPWLVDRTGRLIGLVITESRGSIDEGYLQKNIGPGTTLQRVIVNGRAGWWIAGRPHALLTIDAAGRPNPETLREIGDVLAWVQGGTLIRIESPLGLAETLRIAESMQ